MKLIKDSGIKRSDNGFRKQKNMLSLSWLQYCQKEKKIQRKRCSHTSSTPLVTPRALTTDPVSQRHISHRFMIFSGHEMSFIIFLLCLYKLELFTEKDLRSIVLRIFNKYVFLLILSIHSIGIFAFAVTCKFTTRWNRQEVVVFMLWMIINLSLSSGGVHNLFVGFFLFLQSLVLQLKIRKFCLIITLEKTYALGSGI